MKKLLSVGCALASLSLAAETFVLKQAPLSLTDWKNGEFYEGGVAPTGVATDVVQIPVNMTVTVSSKDTDVIAFLNGISNVQVARTTIKGNAIAVFVIDVDENDTVEWQSWLASTGDGNYSYVQKTGKGALKLKATDNESYRSRWVVSEGELWLPPPPDATKNYYKYWGPVIIEADGVVRTDESTGKSTWQPYGIYNGGLLKNGSSASTPVYLCRDWNKLSTAKVDGRIEGPITVDVRSAEFVLMGTESTFNNTMVLSGNTSYNNNMSVVTVAKLGMKADASSSLGTAAPALHISGNIGGRLVYAGKGETSNKDIRAIAGGSATVATNELCGGEHGGLKLTGSFTKYDTSTVWNPLILFSGDHTNACTFAMGNADFTHNHLADYQGRTYVRYIKKAGAGEWYFPFNKNYTSGGTVEVADGTLAYESIDAKGRVCSLGKATRCYDTAAAQPTDDRRVPYAILLGGDREDQTGMLESRATEVQQCTDRPFGLKGRGGFRANCGGVQYANVFGVGNKAKTLVLDGTNKTENLVCDVSDGSDDGTVSIEKSGSNTWVLGGDQTFTGALTVNGGTLVVRRPAQQYRRYRLLVKEIADSNTNMLERAGKTCENYTTVSICEIGLWDANNRRVNMNLRYRANHLTMQPGEFDFGWSLTPPDATIRRFELLFDGNRYTATDSQDGQIWGAVSATSFTTREGTTNPGAKLTDPLTWIPIDMYLADGEQPVDHFDVMSGDTTWFNPRNPATVQLLASVDGIHWDAVSEDCTYDHTNTRYRWLGGNKDGASNANKDNGYAGQNSPDSSTFNYAYGWKVTKTAPTKVFSLLENVGPVTVANGATLKYEGAADGAPALSQVKLAAGATGSIDGFAFAEDGTFEIDAMAKGSVSVGVTLPNAKDLANVAKWQVKVGNVLKPNYRVQATADGFSVTKSGLMLYIR